MSALPHVTQFGYDMATAATRFRFRYYYPIGALGLTRSTEQGNRQLRTHRLRHGEDVPALAG
jgi:hypothetical protein